MRTNEDDRYFGDSFQKMPAAGFTAMFERMLDHPNIELRLGTEYDDIRDEVHAAQTVWTGPIDEFFDYRLGTLPYRSLHFERETRATPGGRLVQPVAVINYPNERIPYTRVTEFRHLTGQVADFSTLTYEYPTAEGTRTTRSPALRTARCTTATRPWPPSAPMCCSWVASPATST